MTEAGTQKDTRTRLMVEPGQAQSLAGSEVRLLRMVSDAERKQVAKPEISR